jgi:hypothetical protein
MRGGTSAGEARHRIAALWARLRPLVVPILYDDRSEMKRRCRASSRLSSPRSAYRISPYRHRHLVHGLTDQRTAVLPGRSA